MKKSNVPALLRAQVLNLLVAAEALDGKIPFVVIATGQLPVPTVAVMWARRPPTNNEALRFLDYEAEDADISISVVATTSGTLVLAV